jgi:hypothetical protein
MFSALSGASSEANMYDKFIRSESSLSSLSWSDLNFTGQHHESISSKFDYFQHIPCTRHDI